jgi:hypothetical protein
MDSILSRLVYFIGAICIVLVTLSIGWILVWKYMLSKMNFVRELLDLNSPKQAATATPPTSFDERFRQYKVGFSKLPKIFF